MSVSVFEVNRINVASYLCIYLVSLPRILACWSVLISVKFSNHVETILGFTDAHKPDKQSFYLRSH